MLRLWVADDRSRLVGQELISITRRSLEISGIAGVLPSASEGLPIPGVAFCEEQGKLMEMGDDHSPC